MHPLARQVRSFLVSQEFADGLRTTLALLLPALVLARLGHFEEGIVLSVGAFSVSLTDSPGPVVHRRNVMWVCCAVIFAVAVLTGFVQPHRWLLGLEVGVLSFFFSMLVVYGSRAGLLGTAGLLQLILLMDRPLSTQQVWAHSGLVLAGGLWYLALSQLVSTLRPYRPAQRALGNSIREIARFLHLKAAFYQHGKALDEAYRQLVAQQVAVSERQDAVRELLFKSRLIMRESTVTGRALLLTFTETIDLYEQIMAMYYDYASLRQRFGTTGLLPQIAQLIDALADALDAVGFAIHGNLPPRPHPDLLPQLEQLKAHIDALAEGPEAVNVLVLKKILVNLRNLHQRLHGLQRYFRPETLEPRPPGTALDYSRFVGHQPHELKLLLNNFTLQSSVFRHAVRVAVACLLAFTLTQLLPYGEHSYWVVLTTAFILKPAFSLTRQRNYQRLVGTLAGGALGVLVLLLFRSPYVQFGFLVLFMLGTYSMMRVSYQLMVVFMTPFVLILLHFLGLGLLDIARERVLDTVVGCAIAFAVSYLVFPSWESHQAKRYISEELRANVHYLQLLAQALAGQPFLVEDYKLARKDVYVSSANLSALFQRMLSEPRSKQRHRQELHQFVVLNHILSANIAALAAGLAGQPPRPHPEPDQRLVRQAVRTLAERLPLPHTASAAARVSSPPAALAAAATSTPADEVLTEQLTFIRNLSQDIAKVTDLMLGVPAPAAAPE